MFVVSISNYMFSIVLIILFVLLYKHKLIYKYLVLIIGITLIIMMLEPSSLSTTTFNGTIQTIEESNYTNKLVVKTSRNKVIVYLSKNVEVEVGFYGKFICSESSYDIPTYNGSFDYEEYLYNSYIDGVYFASQFIFVKSTFTISIVQSTLQSYFNKYLSGDTLQYSLMLILGIDTFTDEHTEALSSLGIMHLFCISGMHINFILMCLNFILKKFDIRIDKIEKIQIIFSLFLLIITNFSISVIRTVLMFLIAYVFKKKSIKISSLDIASISAILILIFRPRYIYLVSFQLTYLVTFSIILTNDLYNKTSSIKQMVSQSIIAFAVTFPIIININYQINFLTILYSSFISIPFSWLIMPITFISSILRVVFFEPIFDLFNSILYDFNRVDVFIFAVNKMNVFQICIYYFLLFLTIRSVYLKRKIVIYSSSMFVFLVVLINSTILNNVTTVTFFSVGQGDSSLISLAYNKGNILIDAYGGVSDYIKTRGIKTLDYVIITHAHEDHMGDLDIIIDNYNVKNVVGSIHDPDSLQLGFDTYVEAGDKLMLDNLIIDFIAPYESHSDINRASLVFTININDYIFMYTGDTTKEVEMQMIDKKIDLKADVLKVPHHGSSTSSCIEFVNAVDPKYAIFSYGESNNYGLPNASVISRYNMSLNYHTPIDGHIEFYYKKEWNIRFYN